MRMKPTFNSSLKTVVDISWFSSTNSTGRPTVFCLTTVLRYINQRMTFIDFSPFDGAYIRTRTHQNMNREHGHPASRALIYHIREAARSNAPWNAFTGNGASVQVFVTVKDVRVKRGA